MKNQQKFNIKRIEIDIIPPDIDGEILAIFTKNKKTNETDIRITSITDCGKSKKEIKIIDKIYKEGGHKIINKKEKKKFFSMFPTIDLKTLKIETNNHFCWDDFFLNN